MMGGNTKLYKDLLAKFYRDYSRVTEEIKAALESKDQKLAQRLARTVKGVSGNIGENALQAASAELEVSLNKGKPEEIDDRIESFDNILNTF